MNTSNDSSFLSFVSGICYTNEGQYFFCAPKETPSGTTAQAARVQPTFVGCEQNGWPNLWWTQDLRVVLGEPRPSAGSFGRVRRGEHGSPPIRG